MLLIQFGQVTRDRQNKDSYFYRNKDGHFIGLYRQIDYNNEKNLRGRLRKDGTDMRNGRKTSKRETFMEKKGQLHYP